MTSSDEPGRQLLPYLQRADELQKHDPLVAYYCRLYAMEKGLQIPSKDRTKNTNDLLKSLIKRLEKNKAEVTLNSDDYLYVEGFAQNVFTKADKIDRSGKADMNTAKTFYAASIFFEVLRQFGELQPDIEQKQKYAIWKAADIRKAIAEGRSPNPGPPAGSENEGGSLPEAEPETELETNFRPEIPTSGSVSGGYPPSQPFEPLGFASQGNTNPEINLVAPPVPTSSFGFPLNQPPPKGYSDISQSGSASSDSFQFPSSNPDPLPHQHSYSTSSYPNPLLNPSLSPPLNPAQGPGGNPNVNPTVPFIPLYQSHHLGHLSQESQQSSGTVNSSPPVQPLEHSQSYSSAGGVQESNIRSGQHGQDGQVWSSQEYVPPPHKVAEAQKAAKLAVSALAFDDVSSAVSYLRNALDVLTRPC